MREPIDHVRHVGRELKPEDLRALPPTCEAVRADYPLQPNEYVALADLLARHPTVRLMVCNHETSRDLEFLRFFPRLRAFAFSLWSLESVDGLRFLPRDLEQLAWDETKSRRLSLAAILRFPELRALTVAGRHRDLSAIAQLRKLESVTLSSTALEDLDLLKPLRHLVKLDLHLGAIADLSALGAHPQLKVLSLSRIRGLEDLSSLEQLVGLQALRIIDQPRIVTLPRMDALRHLRLVELDGLRSLEDFTPLASAPNLEELRIYKATKQEPSMLTALVRHPTLRKGAFLFGTARKNAEARRMFAHIEDAGAGDGFPGTYSSNTL